MKAITLTKTEAMSLFNYEYLKLDEYNVELELYTIVTNHRGNRQSVYEYIYTDLLTGNYYRQNVVQFGHDGDPDYDVEVMLYPVEKQFVTVVQEVWKPCR